MARIKLIVTGDMEKLALHKSLQGFFPDERYNEETQHSEQVIWVQPRKIKCATTHKLLPDRMPSGPMKGLAEAMIDEAIIGKKGKPADKKLAKAMIAKAGIRKEGPADLVVVIDDVELGNLEQEGIIAKHFQAAVNHVLEEKKYNSATETRYRKMLREKCSFHLLKPMVESYLFGDTDALRVVGVPDGERPQLVHPTDVEQFESNDPVWLRTCHEKNADSRQSKSWWCHERHPKHYLEHLIERGQGSYEETDNGKKALKGLKWKQVPKCPTDTAFIRSLFGDIADWFGIPNPLGGGETNPQFYPYKSVNRANLLLRNM
ncbi:MAG: hypothetical protein GY862_03180 [Gammaproteobacteria bacterium]|nr:hypothetical protein [Gammaproteobacteria bacterium]